jgi:lia operon protein LiaF
MKRWQMVLGVFLIFWGILALIEALFDVDVWRFIGPLILIGVGLLVIFRPKMVGPDVHVQTHLFGDIHMSGPWEATQHEIWLIAGSNKLDFTETVFPAGEAVIKIIGFVADVRVTLPEDVGLKIEASSFVSEVDTQEGKQERILGTLDYESPNYTSAEKQVRLMTFGFVTEIKLS